jgi:uncharacterized protein (DUF885 family)
MAIGVDDHRVPPKYLLEKAARPGQPAGRPEARRLTLRHAAQELSCLHQAARAGAHQEAEMLDAIAQEVLPAYLRFARFLQVSYIPAGRTDPGIWALPDGKKYYQFLIHQSTTTDLTPEQIHQIGLDEVKRDEAEMLVIAQKLGFKDLPTFRASLNANPKLKAASGDALLAAYKSYIGPMEAKLPQLFTRLPKAKLEVVPSPPTSKKPCTPPTTRWRARRQPPRAPARQRVQRDGPEHLCD